MWRDFFHRRSAELTPAERALADRSASIMTGGDFALIRSVEFFEDFAEGGRRQAAAFKVGEGDTFVAITEGGETSSVLGSLKYAAENGARCFLVFNNPADLLRGYLDRCRASRTKPPGTTPSRMSWVSISNKKLIDRGIRLLVELGGVDYEEAAQRIFAAEEWIASQDWTGKEESCAVQVALEKLRK